MNEQRLIDCVREGRSMHAILISGPEGSGKTALARRAAAAYCFGTDAPERLETCPDYYEIGDLPIRVEEIRDLIENTAAQAFSHGRRAYLLKNAHRMTTQAQNALLKTLEEPPQDTLLLLTGTEMGLLPTIRSRCAIFRLGAKPAEAVSRALTAEGMDADTAHLAAAWSDGVVGLAKKLSEEAYRSFRAEAVPIFEAALFDVSPFQRTAKLLGTAVYPPPQGVNEKKYKPDADNATLLLQIFSDIARDALLLKEGGGRLLSPDAEKLSHRMAENFTTPRILGIIATILEAQKRLAFRASPVMTLDTVLVRLTETERTTL